jgi:hypothetical protein
MIPTPKNKKMLPVPWLCLTISKHRAMLEMVQTTGYRLSGGLQSKVTGALTHRLQLVSLHAKKNKRLSSYVPGGYLLGISLILGAEKQSVPPSY